MKAFDYIENVLNEESVSSKIKIRLELPSGATIQEKITNNIKEWQKEIQYELTKPDSNEKLPTRDEIELEWESRIRQTLKNLADKMYVRII
jgi:hypothetical protein